MARKRGRRASSAASSSPGITATRSAASSPQPSIDEPTDKKSKFEKRYKTATKSNEDVLGILIIIFTTTELTKIQRNR
jgi:hypothetical protein